LQAADEHSEDIDLIDNKISIQGQGPEFVDLGSSVEAHTFYEILRDSRSPDKDESTCDGKIIFFRDSHHRPFIR